MTKERRFGTHIKDGKMSHKSMYQQGVEEELARQIAIHVNQDPLCFLKDKNARDKLLARFEMNVLVLKKYPEVVRAMFEAIGDPTPASL